MNTNHCWYNLDIDISNALRSDVSFERTHFDVWSFKNAEEIFNSEWISYIDQLGLSISETMVFYRPADSEDSDAHIDGYAGSYKTFAINWVIGGYNSEMSWYNLPLNENKQEYTTAKTPYISWPIEQLTKIDQYKIVNIPTLVRVDLPHSIVVNDEPRLCISFRTHRFRNNWNTIINYLKLKKLLIERE